MQTTTNRAQLATPIGSGVILCCCLRAFLDSDARPDSFVSFRYSGLVFLPNSVLEDSASMRLPFRHSSGIGSDQLVPKEYLAEITVTAFQQPLSLGAVFAQENFTTWR